MLIEETTELQCVAPASAARAKLWTGRIITGLVLAFLMFDAVGKLLAVAPVIEASSKLGLAPEPLFGIGLLLLVCTVIYAIPRTAILGAILLTGYLGGATAIHVRAATGWFPVIFSIAFGILVWLGLALRERGLTAWILQRR